jgi:hypothetical protein
MFMSDAARPITVTSGQQVQERDAALLKEVSTQQFVDLETALSYARRYVLPPLPGCKGSLSALEMLLETERSLTFVTVQYAPEVCPSEPDDPKRGNMLMEGDPTYVFDSSGTLVGYSMH